MTPEDAQRLAQLKARGKQLHNEFKSAGSAAFSEYALVRNERPWWEVPELGDARWELRHGRITTQEQFEAARRRLVEDVASFEAAVRRADEAGEIYYVPGQGFSTWTAADQRRADRSTWIAAGTFFATNTVPMMLSPVAMKQPLQPARICQGVCGPAFENAEFDPAATRPGKRKATAEAIKARAPKSPSGDFVDPNTGAVIPQNGPYDFGHIPGHEWWRTQAAARQKNWSREDVIVKENDPRIFQIETPASNRGHRYEQKK